MDVIDDTIADATAACLTQMSFNQQQNEFWWMTKVENHWVNKSGGNASLPSRNKSNFGWGGWGGWEHWRTVDVWLEAWNYVSPPSNFLQMWRNSGEIFLIDMQAALLTECRRSYNLNSFWNLPVVVIQTHIYTIYCVQLTAKDPFYKILNLRQVIRYIKKPARVSYFNKVNINLISKLLKSASKQLLARNEKPAFVYHHLKSRTHCSLPCKNRKLVCGMREAVVGE